MRFDLSGLHCTTVAGVLSPEEQRQMQERSLEQERRQEERRLEEERRQEDRGLEEERRHCQEERRLDAIISCLCTKFLILP